MNFCKNCSSRIDDGIPVCPVCGTNFSGTPLAKETEGFFKPLNPDGTPVEPAKSCPLPKSPRMAALPDNKVYSGVSTASSHIPSPRAGYGVSAFDASGDAPQIPQDKAEEFIKSTCTVTNIILSILIIITLAIGGCISYVRFFSSSARSKHSSKAQALIKDYEDAVNDGDSEELLKVSLIDVLSNEQIEEAYETSYSDIQADIQNMLSEFDDTKKLSIDIDTVTDMTKNQIEKLNSHMPHTVEISEGINIECMMYLEDAESTKSKNRTLCAVCVGGEWYMYTM